MKFAKTGMRIGVLLATVVMAGYSASTVETDALKALYDNNNGSDWDSSDNWYIGDPCENNWFGITCTEQTSNGHVTKVELVDNNLDGELPAEIADLNETLEVFDVSFNSLSGTIPEAFRYMTNLKVLDLSVNYFTGTIPKWIGDLDSLEVLLLNNNNLTGNIPTTIGKLTSLTSLWLSSNDISGHIPSEIGNLQELTDLDIRHMKLTGCLPASLGNLTKMVNFFAESNQLSGKIPAGITQWEQISGFYLDYNCNLYSHNSDVIQFIDDNSVGDGYDGLIDSNTHNCTEECIGSASLIPVITYMLD